VFASFHEVVPLGIRPCPIVVAFRPRRAFVGSQLGDHQAGDPHLTARGRSGLGRHPCAIIEPITGGSPGRRRLRVRSSRSTCVPRARLFRAIRLACQPWRARSVEPARETARAGRSASAALQPQEAANLHALPDAPTTRGTLCRRRVGPRSATKSGSDLGLGWGVRIGAHAR
jgi:hypothetical protein